jgi:hypothetical protein
MIMRTLLRHQPTGQYFRALDKWTPSAKRAYDFRFIERAMRFVIKAGFPDMELVLTLEKASRAAIESRPTLKRMPNPLVRHDKRAKSPFRR